MEMYYIISCDGGVRERIRLRAEKFEQLADATEEAGRAAEAYKKQATAEELSSNEDMARLLKVKRIICSDGEVIVARTMAEVLLY